MYIWDQYLWVNASGKSFTHFLKSNTFPSLLDTWSIMAQFFSPNFHGCLWMQDSDWAALEPWCLCEADAPNQTQTSYLLHLLATCPLQEEQNNHKQGSGMGPWHVTLQCGTASASNRLWALQQVWRAVCHASSETSCSCVLSGLPTTAVSLTDLLSVDLFYCFVLVCYNHRFLQLEVTNCHSLKNEIFMTVMQWSSVGKHMPDTLSVALRSGDKDVG